MPICSSELWRLEYTAHELHVLRNTELGHRIPIEQTTLDTLIAEQLIASEDDSGKLRLTERGRLACCVLRKEIEKTVGF